MDLGVSEETIQATKDALVQHRLRRGPSSPTRTSPADIIEDLIPDLAAHLVNSDEQVGGATAMTNAFGYGLDDYSIELADYDRRTRVIEFLATLFLSGDQDWDKSYCGDTVRVEVGGTARRYPDDWRIHSYDIESCEVIWPT